MLARSRDELSDRHDAKQKFDRRLATLSLIGATHLRTAPPDVLTGEHGGRDTS